MTHALMLVDDEVNLCRSLGRALQRPGLSVTAFHRATDALAAAGREPYAVALVDLRMPGMGGLDFLRELRRVSPDTVVIMMTGYATIQTAVEAMRLGAFDYLEKPFENEVARQHVDRALQHYRLCAENRHLREQLVQRFGPETLVATSPSMRDVLRVIERVASSTATVLITGESGTGKELVARALHLLSPRSSGPFVPINCGAIPADLLESELFGHERGAFTGAHAARRGLVEQAHGGTLFLDEVSELLPQLQVKLLRVLQEREVQRVGGESAIRVDVRVVAATNAALPDRIAAGRFRTDLYYRLNVVSVHLPPLRERTEDILPLAHHFLRQYDAAGRLAGFTPDAAALLQRHHWPGNVRELENVVQRAALLAQGEQIDAGDLPAELGQEPGPSAAGTPLAAGKPFGAAREDFERLYILDCLRRNNGNVSRAAREAGLQRQNFYQKLHKFGIRRKDFAS